MESDIKQWCCAGRLDSKMRFMQELMTSGWPSSGATIHHLTSYIPEMLLLACFECRTVCNSNNVQ